MLRADYERSLEAEVNARTEAIRQREEEITLRLLSAAEFRHDETHAHLQRIGLYSATMAQVLGWDQHTVADLRLAAMMHDVGKIGIPDRILLKPGPLTADEYETMKEHTEIGARILQGSQIPLLCMGREIALCHHERWDGKGYPQQLSGPDTPEAGRLVAVLDVYDALTNHRVYRPAMQEEEALAVMRAEGRRPLRPDAVRLLPGPVAPVPAHQGTVRGLGRLGRPSPGPYPRRQAPVTWFLSLAAPPVQAAASAAAHPLLLGHVHSRCLKNDPGIVDQDVDPSPLLENRSHGGFHARRGGDIRFYAEGGAALLLNFCRHLFRAVTVKIGHADACAFFGQQQGCGFADSGPAPCYDCHFVTDTQIHMIPSWNKKIGRCPYLAFSGGPKPGRCPW